MGEIKDFRTNADDDNSFSGDYKHEVSLSEDPDMGAFPVATSLTVDGLVMQGENDVQEEENEESLQRTPRGRMVGAAICGGILGMMLGGFILGAVAGAGAAFAASRDGAPGDVARAMGDVALTARDKAKEVNSKHQIVDKTKQATASAWEKAKEYDRKHNILEKTKNFVVSTAQRVAEFNREHRVLEQTREKVGRFFSFVTGKIKGEDRQMTGTGHEPLPLDSPAK